MKFHLHVHMPIMPKQDLPDHLDSGVDPLAVFNGKGFATGSER